MATGFKKSKGDRKFISFDRTKNVINRVISGGSKPPAWANWWNSLSETQAQPYVEIINRTWQESAGLGADDLPSDVHGQMVIDLFTSSVNGEDLGGLEKNLNTYVKNTDLGKAYKDAFTSFESSIRKQRGDSYDKEFWTRDRLKAEFDDNYAAQGGNEAGVAVDDTMAVIDRDWNKKTDAGIFDATTGEKLIDVDTAAADFDINTFQEELGTTASADLDKIFSDAGIDKAQNQPLYDHLNGMLSRNEIDTYEAQQLTQADRAFVDAQYEKDKAEYFPKLDESTQREIGLIEAEGERLKGVTAEEFEKFAPDVAATAKQFGGATREDTFISDTLAKFRADLEVNRQNQVSALKLSSELSGEERRRAFESGDFDKLQSLTDKAAQTGLQQVMDTLEIERKSKNQALAVNMNKSAILAQRSMDRFNREAQKAQDRILRQQRDAAEKANKRARKLGAFVDYGIAAAGIIAAPFTGGTSLALTAQGGLNLLGRQAGASTVPQLDLKSTGTSISNFFTRNNTPTTNSGSGTPSYADYLKFIGKG